MANRDNNVFAAQAGSDAEVDEGSGIVKSAVEPMAPREGTKGALILSMLSSPDGVSIAQLMEATGWLSHTVRAALTGIRKRGFSVVREPAAEGPSRYRIQLESPKPTRKSKPRRARQAVPETAAHPGA